MDIAMFFVLMTLAPFGERSRQMMEPIHHLLGPRMYRAEFKWAEIHKEGGQDFECISTGFELVPLESLSLPVSKSSWVTTTPDGDVKTKQAASCGVRRLPFGLFLVTLRIDQRVKEPKRTSPSSTRSSWFRIVTVGRRVSIDLGKNKRTGNRRVLDVSIKRVNP